MSNNIFVALKGKSKAMMGMLGVALILLSMATLAFRVKVVEAEPRV